MATSELLEDLQSVHQRLDQLSSIKDNQLLVVTTSTLIGKVRNVCEGLPRGDVLRKLVVQSRPILMDVISSAKDIANGKEKDRTKLEDATKRLSGVLADVQCVLQEEQGDGQIDKNSGQNDLAYYRAKLEERKERIGGRMEAMRVEGTLISSWETFSVAIDDLREALGRSSPDRDDILRSASLATETVCSLLDAADMVLCSPLPLRSEVFDHAMRMIQTVSSHNFDVVEIKSVVSLLCSLVKALNDKCKEQVLEQHSKPKPLKQDDGVDIGNRCIAVWDETDLQRSPVISKAKALFDFDRDENAENLRFFKGDIIEVIKKNQSGWWEGRVGKEMGLFPSSFVLELTEEKSFRHIRSETERHSSTGSGESKFRGSSLASVSDSRLQEKIPASETFPRFYTWSGKDESQLSQPVHKEGIMKKEGGGHKSWKTRWFILDLEKISYYKPSQLKSPMGTVHLRDYNFAAVTGDRPGHQNCFKLCGASDHRVYYFSTSSREEMNDWIAHINQAIMQYKKSAGRLPEKSAHRQFEGCVSEVAAAECIEYLLSDNHVKHEGLFRVPGNAAQVKRFLEDVDQGTLPDLDQIHNPKTVASVLKKLIKEHKVETMVLSSIAKELLEEVEMKCSPNKVRSLLIGVRSFRLLGGLIRLFSEVLASKEAGKPSVSVADLARAFGVYVFEDLNVVEAVVVLDYLLNAQSEVFA